MVDSHVNIDPESISRIGASTFNIFSGETPKSKCCLGMAARISRGGYAKRVWDVPQ